MTQNTDFSLTNEKPEDWTATQFTEKDPFNSESLCRIVLCVDWEEKTAVVETRYNNQGYPVREHNGLDSAFTIPARVDFSEFPEYYEENVRPLLQEISRYFETFWNGSNMIGRLNFNESPEDQGTGQYEFNLKMEYLLRDAPEHEKYIYFDVGESFQNYQDILDILDGSGVDFMTADLEDIGTVQKIRAWLEDDFLYVMDDNEFKRDLERIREAIEEE